MEATALSFETTDKLYLTDFCERRQRHIKVESNFVEGSLPLASNSVSLPRHVVRQPHM